MKGPRVVKAAETFTSDSADADITNALQKIDKAKTSPDGYSNLAAIYIKKARQSGDFGLNRKAEIAVAQALEIDPQDLNARKLQASLHLTFHRFDEALKQGLELQKELPSEAFVFGVLTDANVELGNYQEAIDAAQKMVDLKPNTASYARVAHLRSLHGDSEGAVEMMKLAAKVADPLDKETQSWCLTQLGDELLKDGKYADAENTYDEALSNFPNYYLAMAGKGRAFAAQNELDEAAFILTKANEQVPNVETAILLGDVYTKQGELEKAKQQYDLVELIEQKIGLNNDRKRLALMWADHDVRLDEALAIARGEFNIRKDILTADAYAWTLYKTGDIQQAKTVIDQATKLKTRDARIMYHAGMIEKGLGNKAEAKRPLELALKINPAFDLLQTEAASKHWPN